MTENNDGRISGMEEHWKPLLDLIQLVEPLPLRRALREWVNKNQNCAYSVKMGHCDMNCDSCLNDVTMGIIYKDATTKDEGEKNEKDMPGMRKP